jgi:predicted nucleic acid-binding protein
MAALVIDASVAVKWFIAEDRVEEALRLRERDEDLIAPASVVFEVFHALWDAARTRRISTPQLKDIEADIPGPFARLVPMEDLFDHAARLARTLSHPIYDCAYLALSEREGASLVTADERLFTVARKARIKAKLL